MGERNYASMTTLAEILAQKWRDVAALGPPPSAAWKPAPRTLTREQNGELFIAAEIKRQSPSAGALAQVDIGERALAYANGGARVISVLTDKTFFGGGFSDITEARVALVRALGEEARPRLLCKEFVVDETQLDHAASSGADMALLIARIVSPARLRELVEATRARGMEPLVEVWQSDEVAGAIAAGARVMGVNTRDLDALTFDLGRAEQTLQQIPAALCRMALSGVKRRSDVVRWASFGADGVLVGEALMRANDPASALRVLRGAER